HQPRQRQAYIIPFRAVKHHPEAYQRVRLPDVLTEGWIPRVELRETAVHIAETRVERQAQVFGFRYPHALGEERGGLRQLLHRQALMSDVDARRGTDVV